MQERELIKTIYSSSDNSTSLVFTHADKIWVMPECAVKGAMDMYQPSSRGGKCLKNAVVKDQKIPFYMRGPKLEREEIDIDPDFRNKLEEMLGISDFYVATYMGDTSTEQNDKAVLQIYNDNEIFAYVKVTTNSENAKRFKKESDTFRILHNFDIEFVPKTIGLELDNEVKMFAQSSDKPFGQEVKLVFDENVLEAVDEIVGKTKKTIKYEDSDFYKDVERLKEYKDVFDEEQQSIIDAAINIIEEAGISEYAFSHGDYTPWNVYYKGDEIRLFDLEYCSETMPTYIDVFHYLTQMTLLGKRYTAQCAMREYERNMELVSKYIENPKLTFICYLVWIISFYLERTKDIELIKEKLDVWVEMLEYLTKYL